jgi:hypothetical protein
MVVVESWRSREKFVVELHTPRVVRCGLDEGSLGLVRVSVFLLCT